MSNDPSLYLPENNVKCYEYDSAGHILSFGTMAKGYVLDFIAQGLLYGIGEATDATHYVDAPKTKPVLKPRPVIDWSFDKTEMLPSQEATLRDIPPATVTFTGQSSGSQPHDTTGPLSIGWTVPGDYVVSVAAWPYKPASFALKVKGKLPVSVPSVNLQVTS